MTFGDASEIKTREALRKQEKVFVVILSVEGSRSAFNMVSALVSESSVWWEKQQATAEISSIGELIYRALATPWLIRTASRHFGMGAKERRRIENLAVLTHRLTARFCYFIFFRSAQKSNGADRKAGFFSLPRLAANLLHTETIAVEKQNRAKKRKKDFSNIKQPAAHKKRDSNVKQQTHPSPLPRRIKTIK